MSPCLKTQRVVKSISVCFALLSVTNLVGCSVKPFFNSLLNVSTLAESSNHLNDYQSANKTLANNLLNEQNNCVTDMAGCSRYDSGVGFSNGSEQDGTGHFTAETPSVMPSANVYTIAAENCTQTGQMHTIMASSGTIYIRKFNENVTKDIQALLDRGLISCDVRVIVPEGKSMELIVEDLPGLPCAEGYSKITIQEAQPSRERQKNRPIIDELFMCFYNRHSQMYTKFNVVDIFVLPFKLRFSGLHWAVVHFQAMPVSGRYVLNVVNTSSTSGYLATYRTHPRPYAMWMSARHDLILPSNHTMILSFPLYEVGRSFRSYSTWEGVTLLFSNGTSQRLPEKWHRTIIPPAVLHESVQVYFNSSRFVNFGFKMLFSFHAESETPIVLTSEKFDCSVSFYASFNQHLHCNLERECEKGEDEQNCSFYHPACNNTVGYGDKCYSLVTWPEPLTPAQAENACRARGGQLANIKTPGQRHAVSLLFTYGKRRFFYFVGAHRNDSTMLSPQYRYHWFWNDGTVAYDFNITYTKTWASTASCAYCDPFLSTACSAHQCNSTTFLRIRHFLCELDQLRPTALSFPAIVSSYKTTSSSTWTFVRLFSHVTPSTLMNGGRYGDKQMNNSLHSVSTGKADTENVLPKTMVVCQDGHLTYDFLSCSADSFCGDSSSMALCSTLTGDKFPMFSCASKKKWVHYSMVCDFREDCADGSDESFCVHPSICPALTCRNSQCFEISQRCDDMQHCVDNSDERGCSSIERYRPFYPQYSIPPPVIIGLDGHGEHSHRRLGPTESCPETHFKCPGQYVYCLPVYVRCNDIYDCQGHEDEAECDSYMCPGYYRCRASSVCVHLDHLCDGVPHCPQQDDEWMCSHNLVCPERCRCQGLAFTCSKSFTAGMHPYLRYLDASGSGTDFHHLANNDYIIFLDLSFSDISVLSTKQYPNLIHLDLSHNRIRILKIDTLINMANLRVLDLTGNPVTHLSRSQLNFRHEQLRTLNLSYSRLEIFDSKYFSNFSRIITLNISFSSLHTIGRHGFTYLPNLMTLDLYGSPVHTFSSEVLRGLSVLQYIRTDNYKLCCRQNLPKYFQIGECPIENRVPKTFVLRRERVKTSLS